MASGARQARKRAHSSSDEDDSGLVPAAARPTLPNKRVIAATSFSSRARSSGAETSIVAELEGVASAAGSKRPVAGGAFATSEIDTELDRDGRALYEKQMALQEIARSVVVSDKKLYRGQAGYTNFIQKDGELVLSRPRTFALTADRPAVVACCSRRSCVKIQGDRLTRPAPCSEQRSWCVELLNSADDYPTGMMVRLCYV